MLYKPFSKNIIIQESFTLENDIDELKNTRTTLSQDNKYNFNTHTSNKEKMQDVKIKDDKQIIINNNHIYILGAIAGMTIFVFNIFKK